ncbi:MAG: hypothetical protein EBV73_05505, partial [Rhodocyclales bacterium]|nr:hypothetical protein [Rhodocyclales bacterium]
MTPNEAQKNIQHPRKIGRTQHLRHLIKLDRTGTVLLDDLGDNVTRTLVPLSDISPKIQQASIAIEDATFYEHAGI